MLQRFASTDTTNRAKIISIGQATKLLGVHVQTMRNWEKSGKLKPDSISPGGTRRYNRDRIVAISGKKVPTVVDERKSIAYARVSSCDPKEDLAINQVEAMVYEARI